MQVYIRRVLSLYENGGIVMVDVSNQHYNEDGSITVILNGIEEIKEFIECINISNGVYDEE